MVIPGTRRAFLRSTAAVALGSLAMGASWTSLRADTPAGLSAGTQAVVDGEALNLRGGPGLANPVVGQVSGGTTVDLLGGSSDGAWWRVAADAGVGYVDASYLRPTGAPTAGVFDLDLAFPYAAQATPVWCDPADVQMWLAYHAAAVPDSYQFQQTVWSWELANNAGFTEDQWDCSPYAVASAVYNWLPDRGANHFRYDDPRAGSQLLAWLLARPDIREPSVVLIWRGDHYVLVRGVRALSDPSQNPSATIVGFYVADPNRSASTWLGEDRFIPMDRWLGELFTPVSYQTPHTGVPGDIWQNSYVSIQRGLGSDGPSPDGQHNASPASYA